MAKLNFSKLCKDIGNTMSKHSPEILTGIGIAGMITTTILAVKATPEALELLDRAKCKKKQTPEDEPKLTAVETVKTAWKPYLPAVIIGVTSTACLIGGTRVSLRRNAALATAYQLSTTALSEYKEKVVETIGERKERAIHDELAKDKVEQIPVQQSEVIFTGKGESLCLDDISGRYFKSDRNRIDRAMNKLNQRMAGGMEMCISLNEFYDAIGIPQIPMGESLGWRVDKGLIDIHYGAVLTSDNEPCMVISFLVPPEYGFNKLY